MVYEESKNININGFIIAYSLSIVMALFIGYIYSTIIIVNPFPFLNVFLTIGIGLTLGILNRLLSRITHNRYKRSQIVQSIIMGVLVIIFRWSNHILNAQNNYMPNFLEYISHLYYAFNPKYFFNSIFEINKIGTEFYFMPGASIIGKLVINNFGLAFIWILEIFIVLAGSIVAVYRTKIYPYSETFNKWYQKYTLVDDFASVVMIEDLINDLKTNPLPTLKKLDRGDAMRFSKIHLFYLPEETNQYITVDKNYISRKSKKNTTIVINNLRIDTESANLILKDFNYKKEKIEII